LHPRFVLGNGAAVSIGQGFTGSPVIGELRTPDPLSNHRRQRTSIRLRTIPGHYTVWWVSQCRGRAGISDSL